MYPGSCAERSKGGLRSSSAFDPRAISDVRTASIARSAKRFGTAPDSTAHDCAIGVDGALVVLRRAQRASVVVISAPVPFAVPRLFEPRCQAARGVLVIPALVPASPLASHSGTKAVNTLWMKKPSHVLSPRPSAPTLFMPSFQSPVPKSGSP